MPLADGTRLEHFEIVGPLGAGGMGEVYRAVDTKLRREVALKILPAQFAADPSRLARFEREAHLLASLNHPNIAAIYGLEHAGGVRFLVLELVEGPTLGERLQSGPLELSEALRIATGIAEALEAAHEKGVVHRDLKPGNVKITPQGKVKVLDFGLAKALGEAEPVSAPGDPDGQSTVTLQETRAGVVMGTAAYMSPEQAEARPTDKRSDVWSFGVVLYEMLSGKRCFDGKSTSHIIVHLLEDEPDWTRLPENVPAPVRHLLERCLQKDPAKRLRDVGDLRLQLEAVASGPTQPARETPRKPTSPPPRHTRLLWPSVGATLALAAVLLGFVYFRPKPAPAQAMRFDIAPPEGVTLTDNYAVSPDGRKLAFIATGADRISRLWVRSLETGDARALEGTDNAFTGPPIWSPDSRSLAFVAYQSSARLMRVDTSGGLPQTLSDIGIFPATGGFWTDDRIVFGSLRAGVRQVPVTGGAPVRLISASGVQLSPSFLPDRHHFVYMNFSTPSDGGVYVASLDTPAEQQRPKKLLAETSPVAFVPDPAESAGSAKGYLLFMRGFGLSAQAGTLTAQAFDSRKLELAGEPLPIAEQVGSFSVSPGGVMVYRNGAPRSALSPTGSPDAPSWFDRRGKVIEAAVEPGSYSSLALSPDEKRLAVSRLDPTNLNNQLWVFEFARNMGKRFSFDTGLDTNPVWSPDGSRIVFSSNPGGGPWQLYVKPSNGAGDTELLFQSDIGKWPTSWSRDGRFLLFHKQGGADLYVLPLKDGKVDKEKGPYLFAREATGGRFSPDMRWIAYVARDSGQQEVWVRPFDPASPAGSPPSSGKWMISRGGGASVRWRGDSKELFYTTSDSTVMSVEVNTSPGSPVFDAGLPKPLFKASTLSGAFALYWDVSADGKRFLLHNPQASPAAAPTPAPNAPYKVVLNWTSLLRK